MVYPNRPNGSFEKTIKVDSKNVVTTGKMKLPVVGLGTRHFNSTKEEVDTALKAAIETGYRLIDTAAVYENESAIGETLKKLFDSGKITREELFIVTKLPTVGNRREDVEPFLKKSLDALQLDYVDLYLIHNPVGHQNVGFDVLHPTDEIGRPLLDMSTNLLELWKGMEAQVDAGRTKNIGVSNFNQNQLKRILDNCRIPPANLQVELHIYLQQKELVSFCKQNGVTVSAYAPLCNPGRNKSLDKGESSIEGFRIMHTLEDPVIKEIARKQNKEPSQVLLRYLIQYGVAVIPKSINPARIKENFDVFDFELTNEEFEKISALDRGEEGRLFHARGHQYYDLLSSHPEFSLPK